MDWGNADEWATKANSEKQIKEIEPRWSWDCGLKLDYDGGLLRVSSRFYQVADDVFSGSVSLCIGDADIFSSEFSCRHIDVLKKDVEEYVKFAEENIKHLLTTNLITFARKMPNTPPTDN